MEEAGTHLIHISPAPPLTSACRASCSPACFPRCSQPDSVERLLVRLLPRPSDRTVFAGDVIAFASPFTVAATAAAAAAAAAPAAAASSAAAWGLEGAGGLQQDTMVRRVAAMPGDELVTGEEEGDESFVVPEVRAACGCGCGFEVTVGGGSCCLAEEGQVE
jgi:hypothetical protein